MLNECAVGGASCQCVAYALQQRDKDQQHDHAHIDNILVMEVLPIVDGKASDAACAHSAGGWA